MSSRLEHPSAVGPYKPLEPLFDSYWGTLWAACGTDDERRYALRLVDDKKLLPEERDRLERAAVTIAGVEHASIVPVRAVASDRDGLSIASDPIEALSLSQLLTKCRERGSPLALEACLQIVLDILAAAAFMHIRAPALFRAAGGFAYGGLTPDAFAVCSDGRTRMLEMTLPSVLRRFRMLTQEPMRIGYDAAEVLQVGIAVDASADVFSIGVMLWEMLRNQRLFPGTPFHVISKLRAGPLPRIDHDGARPLPAALADVVACALEREAQERFVSAGEMATELRDVSVAGSTEAVQRALRSAGIRSAPQATARRATQVPPALAGARPRRVSDRAPTSRRSIPRERRSVPPPKSARSAAMPPLEQVPPVEQPVEQPTEQPLEQSFEQSSTRARPAISELPTTTPPAPSSSAVRERILETSEPVSVSPPPVSPLRLRAGATRLVLAAVVGAVIAVVVTLVVTGRDAETTHGPTAPASVRTSEVAPAPSPKPPPPPVAEPQESAEPEDARDAGAPAPPAPKGPLPRLPPRPRSDRLPDDI